MASPNIDALIEGESMGGLLLDDFPDVDRHSCQLLGPTALVVQGLMGILVILSLVYKRHRENPVRPWRIWLFDVSKQIVGQMFVHGSNVLISDLIAHHTTANACVFYFLNILVDTTLGIGIIYVMLHAINDLLTNKLQWKGFESGQYGTPPSFNFWARQASVYVLSLTTMKLIVIGLFALFPGIFKVGEWLLSWTWTGEGDSLQVIFTMGIFPIAMNILQFWLIDSIVKGSSKSAAVALPTESQRPSFDDPDREPLFAASSDGEEEDQSILDQTRYDIENPPPNPDNDSKPFPIKSTEYKSAAAHSHASNHSYPPSIASSSTSPRATFQNPDRKAKRRSPPPPLRFQPSGQPVVNSPLITGMQQPQPPVVLKAESKADVQDDGADWGLSWDGADNWDEGESEEKTTMNNAWFSRPGVQLQT